MSTERAGQSIHKDAKVSIDRCTTNSSTGEYAQVRNKASWWYRLSQFFLASRETRAWSASWAHTGPISGLVSLCVVVGSLVASIGILTGSDNEMVERWPTPPSTFIAAFTALSNLGVRYALAQGAIITWWRRACKGTTLSRLHTDWRAKGVRGECVDEEGIVHRGVL